MTALEKIEAFIGHLADQAKKLSDGDGQDGIALDLQVDIAKALAPYYQLLKKQAASEDPDSGAEPTMQLLQDELRRAEEKSNGRAVSDRGRRRNQATEN